MTQDPRNAMFEKTMIMLKPALERVASDAEFRNRLELTPLAALAELKVELDDETRAELQGRRFSEFWAARRKAVEGPVEVRDLPPKSGELAEQELEAVAGGLGDCTGTLTNFAPPYVPTGPVTNFAPPYVPAGPVTLSPQPATNPNTTR